MLCPCKEFRLTDLRRILYEQPNISFDSLLQQTGAGGTCTACLLDLEYYYTTLPRDNGASAASGGTQSRRETVSLKQRLYRLLDGLSPQTPMPLADYMPVLYGRGLEEWVCVANQPLLYESAVCATDMDLTLVVRDEAGQEVHHETRPINAGTAQRISVSHYLGTPSGEIGIGSVRISRRFHAPGVRGTTRPQVQIVGASGACAVHSQAPGRLRDRWLSIYHRPADERLFVSAVNASTSPLGVEIAYPFADGAASSSHCLSIPAYGAALHEIILSDSASHVLKGTLFGVRFRTDGLGKMHLFCATPELDRLSIDHL